MNDFGNVFCENNLNLNPLRDNKDIENTIIKKYRSKLWAPFIKGIQEFDLLQDGDVVGIAISGGKDSLLMAKLFQELVKHGKQKIEIKFIAMNPGYNDRNLNNLIENAKHLEIDLKIFDNNVFEVISKIASDYPCYMCARMRRGSLYNYAKDLGCNKIALGHHFDDIIETTLLNVLYSGNFKTMMPKLKSTNYEGMELIRPMVYIREKDIKAFTEYNGINALGCGCVVAAGKVSTKRREIKELIENLKKVYKDVDKSIFQAANNVNLDAVLGWIKDGNKNSFLDEY